MRRTAFVRPVLLLATLASTLSFLACGGRDGVVLEKEPRIVVAPESEANTYVFELSQLRVGEERTLDLELRNLGDAALTVHGLDWTGDSDEAGTPAFRCGYGTDDTPCGSGGALPATLAPWGSGAGGPERLALRVRFVRPTDGHAPTAALVIDHDDARTGPLALRFTTGEAAARILVSPSRILFEDVRKDELETATGQILNSGGADLVIDRLTLDADGAFAVTLRDATWVTSEETRAGVPLEPPLVLAPQRSIPFGVAYEPKNPQGAQGTLRLHSNDPSSEWTPIYLEAKRTGSVIVVDPLRMDFGGCEVGRTSARQLRILSTGVETLEVSAVYLEEASSRDFELDLAALAGDGRPVSPDDPLRIPPNGMETLEVYFTPDVTAALDPVTGHPSRDTGTIVVESNSFEQRITVPVEGFGLDPSCPVAVIACEEGDEVDTLTNLHLSAAGSYSVIGRVVDWEWSVEQPVGGASVFFPAPSAESVQLEANVAGTYLFSLDVWDSTGQQSCATAYFELVAVPRDAIHVELLWTTPADPDETDVGQLAGSDVDLHLAHPNAPSPAAAAPDLDGDGLPDPWFDIPWDCYFQNPSPPWMGSFASAGNPRLDRDDTDGAGPENVNLAAPEDGARYRIAAHYWNDHGYGASYATVRIYVRERLAYEEANVRLLDQDLWCVAFVDWPSGQVTPCQAPGGGRWITPGYQHPLFGSRGSP